MDHIDSFEEICSTTRSNGVPADFLKCKLFSFSLTDKAHRWLKSLPPDSLTKWDECKAVFLSHFYTKSKTTMLKNRISSFQQNELEPFFKAWERFKEYVRDCPHHGYAEEQLLRIFYDGADWRFRIALDSGSNGSFMTKTVDEARELINNLASSNNNNCPEYDRSRGRTSNPETRKIDALTDKLELLLRRDQRNVNRIDEINGEDDDQEEIQYLNGQSRPTYYRNNFAPAYRGSQGENTQGSPRAYQPRTYPPQGQGFQKKFNQNQGMQGKPPYIGERSDSNINRFQPLQQSYARP